MCWYANFYKNSAEGNKSGLNWFEAEVKKINSSGHKTLRLPHWVGILLI